MGFALCHAERSDRAKGFFVALRMTNIPAFPKEPDFLMIKIGLKFEIEPICFICNNAKVCW